MLGQPVRECEHHLIEIMTDRKTPSMKCLYLLALTMLWVAHPPVVRAEPVRTETVTYQAAGVPLEGYLAYETGAAGQRPGVLVVHEWWGLNDYVRRRARQLAHLGYVALALDMYGGGESTGDPEQAGALAGAMGKNPGLAKARFEAALVVLRQNRRVDAERVAAIGYCFGGTVVLRMARAGVDLRAWSASTAHCPSMIRRRRAR
jgi:dienelactone hydrolase